MVFQDRFKYSKFTSVFIAEIVDRAKYSIRLFFDKLRFIKFLPFIINSNKSLVLESYYEQIKLHQSS